MILIRTHANWEHGASRVAGQARYGRNSKVLQAWVRSQWNLATADPEDEPRTDSRAWEEQQWEILPDTGVRFEESPGIYRKDEEFDAETYRGALGVDNPKKGNLGRQYSAEDIVECLSSDWVRVSVLERQSTRSPG